MYPPVDNAEVDDVFGRVGGHVGQDGLVVSGFGLFLLPTGLPRFFFTGWISLAWLNCDARTATGVSPIKVLK